MEALGINGHAKFDVTRYMSIFVRHESTLRASAITLAPAQPRLLSSEIRAPISIIRIVNTQHNTRPVCHHSCAFYTVTHDRHSLRGSNEVIGVLIVTTSASAVATGIFCICMYLPPLRHSRL